MNFYKHHIGDYAQATAHLSFIEDAAYSRLIRKYYAEEKPLPPEVKAVQRLVGARTKEEKQAVSDVLVEFFELQEDGWHSKRCDAEIERANAQAETNRQIAVQREERRKNRILSNESNTNREKHEHESLNESCSSREPSQTPDTRRQTKTEYKQAASTGLDPAAAPPDPIGARALQLVLLLRQRGAAIAAGNPHTRQWAETGVTDAQALAALEAAEQRRADSGSVQPVNAGLLNAILLDSQRAPPRNVHDQRADTIAALTGRNRTHEQPGIVIDITPSAVTRGLD